MQTVHHHPLFDADTVRRDLPPKLVAFLGRPTRELDLRALAALCAAEAPDEAPTDQLPADALEEALRRDRALPIEIEPDWSEPSWQEPAWSPPQPSPPHAPPREWLSASLSALLGALLSLLILAISWHLMRG
jgi:hypothetical protein